MGFYSFFRAELFGTAGGNAFVAVKRTISGGRDHVCEQDGEAEQRRGVFHGVSMATSINTYHFKSSFVPLAMAAQN
jgi:hypothetical protein